MLLPWIWKWKLEANVLEAVIFFMEAEAVKVKHIDAEVFAGKNVESRSKKCKSKFFHFYP